MNRRWIARLEERKIEKRTKKRDSKSPLIGSDLFGTDEGDEEERIHRMFGCSREYVEEEHLGSSIHTGIGCTLAMANSKSSSNFRNAMFAGKQSLLPPKSPFPSVSAYADYTPTGVLGPKAVPKPREGEIYTISVLPLTAFYWRSNLLGLTISLMSQRLLFAEEVIGVHQVTHLQFDYLKDVQHAPYYAEANSAKPKNRAWESLVNA
ncbi:hypothetical protein LWI29_031065 [Acer saccharum]|uniref:Uncharacterized protein n=1 Tax=Acer saccharum TaxID=4024 RepID=A0AA39RFM8_ACESA|nr:hypothetical protein LWI29_031065 [Acer saccharum]